MDDRDFIYWVNGFLASKDASYLARDSVDEIIENICAVYENFQKTGCVADADAYRLVSFTEGVLMYHENNDAKQKVLIFNLIKNEVAEIFSRWKDDEQEKIPLGKFSLLFKDAAQLEKGPMSRGVTAKDLTDMVIFFEKNDEEKRMKKGKVAKQRKRAIMKNGMSGSLGMNEKYAPLDPDPTIAEEKMSLAAHIKSLMIDPFSVDSEFDKDFFSERHEAESKTLEEIASKI